MFQGDDPRLTRVVGQALALARDLGHPQVRSEHLLLALTMADGQVAQTLTWHGATPETLSAKVRDTATTVEAETGDRDMAPFVGSDVDQVLRMAGTPALEAPSGRGPRFPLGVLRARRGGALASSAFALDAQAAYEASLRLALARREREHRPEHLALVLTALDPAVAWLLEEARIHRHALVTDLAESLPPPRRTLVSRVERRLGRRIRVISLIRRYERIARRTVPAAGAAFLLGS